MGPTPRDSQWLGKVIGKSAVELTMPDATSRENALLDPIHRVQRDAGKADVSLAATFNPPARTAAGPVTVREIAALTLCEIGLAEGATSALDRRRLGRTRRPDPPPRPTEICKRSPSENAASCA